MNAGRHHNIHLWLGPKMNRKIVLYLWKLFARNRKMFSIQYGPALFYYFLYALFFFRCAEYNECGTIRIQLKGKCGPIVGIRIYRKVKPLARNGIPPLGTPVFYSESAHQLFCSSSLIRNKIYIHVRCFAVMKKNGCITRTGGAGKIRRNIQF